jgi:putative hydrolase of the HAD superfamily
MFGGQKRLSVDAVIVDLFGTLVAAPTPTERHAAARALARAAHVDQGAVDSFLAASWTERHDGHLPTIEALAARLCQATSAAATSAPAVAATLVRLAHDRLPAPPGVVTVLQALRQRGIQVAVLSDASAEIAHVWPDTGLAAHTDTAVFSCVVGATKPAAVLYETVLDRLGAAAAQTVYVGDGGGDELAGAIRHGIHAIAVPTLGGPGALAWGQRAWAGESMRRVEDLAQLLGLNCSNDT